MSHLFAFLKLFGDISLWLGFSSGILSLFGSISNLTVVAPAVAFGCMCAHYLRDRRDDFRWFGLVPAIATLLLCRSIVDALAILPPVVYLFLSIREDSLDPDSGELSYRFNTTVTLAVIGSIICVVRHINWGFLCCVLCLCSNVFLMRMLRHDAADYRNRKLMALESGLLAVVCLLCLLLSRQSVIDASLAALKAFYDTCIIPLLMLIVAIGGGIMLVIEWIANLIYPDMLNFGPERGSSTEGTAPDTFFEEIETIDQPFLLMLLKIGCVLIFLLVAYHLFRYLMNGIGRKKEASNAADLRKDLPNIPRDNGPGRLNRSPVARIRRSYASYCKTFSKTVGALRPHDTTRSVNLRAELQNDTRAQKLRDLYLRARYTEHGDLKNADAQEAATLSRQLRSKLEDTHTG